MIPDHARGLWDVFVGGLHESRWPLTPMPSQLAADLVVSTTPAGPGHLLDPRPILSTEPGQRLVWVAATGDLQVATIRASKCEVPLRWYQVFVVREAGSPATIGMGVSLGTALGAAVAERVSACSAVAGHTQMPKNGIVSVSRQLTLVETDENPAAVDVEDAASKRWTRLTAGVSVAIATPS